MMLRSEEGFGLLGARCEENYLKEKMAEKHSEAEQNGFVSPFLSYFPKLGLFI